jgi:predicted cupin superfamily sugar epimerase
VTPGARDLIERLELVPLPQEGGWYRETWRSSDVWPQAALPPRYRHDKHAATAILYLLTDDACSLLHRLPTDELYCFHDGDPVELLMLAPGGAGTVVRFGPDLAAGDVVQARVPAGVWQGSRLVAGGAWALFSVIVAPGFDPDDYEHGERATLLQGWPTHAARIRALTRA